MTRWPQIIASVAMATCSLLASSALAQEEDRDFGPSRFSEPRISRLPPIVSKGSSPAAKSKASPVKSPASAGEAKGPTIRPSFTPVDPKDLDALLDPTTVIAIVGGHYIITGDVIGDVNLTIPPEVKAQQTPAEYMQLQAMYLQMFLGYMIQSKLLYTDFMRREKASEIVAKIDAMAGPAFDSQIQEMFTKVIAADTIESREALKKSDPAVKRIADLMVRENLSTMGEVDVALEKYGTSLAKERRRYIERAIGAMVLRDAEQGAVGKPPTREQLYDYYQEHQLEFARPARCRWEKLSVLFSKFASKDDAYQAIAEMGDDVFLRGASLAAVAKRTSQTADSIDGGYHDWTKPGALRSAILDKAIFAEPVGKLSDIIEDEDGLHIIRVIERDDGGFQSFSLVKTQDLIRERLKEGRVHEAREAHFAKLRRQIAVWTIFDDATEESDRNE